ncbi:hypothetical protein Acr_10g0009820 [Actinidia rufa]|uniref:Uncharacterized protein n=1 Tax=Actinidia rufa TaxID=165716 RepID=A0A7J0FCH9_9ERIC|nr:hypothetical protein Acr_10g0009820 [Actinidia rufa]
MESCGARCGHYQRRMPPELRPSLRTRYHCSASSEQQLRWKLGRGAMIGSVPEGYWGTKGGLHVRVPSNSPHNQTETSVVGHELRQCLITDTAVSAYDHSPSRSLSNDRTVSASCHALSQDTKGNIVVLKEIRATLLSEQTYIYFLSLNMQTSNLTVGGPFFKNNSSERSHYSCVLQLGNRWSTKRRVGTIYAAVEPPLMSILNFLSSHPYTNNPIII